MLNDPLPNYVLIAANLTTRTNSVLLPLKNKEERGYYQFTLGLLGTKLITDLLKYRIELTRALGHLPKELYSSMCRNRNDIIYQLTHHILAFYV